MKDKEMKTLNAILVMVLLAGFSAEAQYKRGRELLSHYGLNISQINSGSGHGMGYSINGSIQKGRKALEIGIVYQTRENRIAGADFRYKVFLGRFDEGIYRQKILRTYLQYNLLYHKATVDEPTIISTEAFKGLQLTDSEPGLVATVEHYVSIGVQFKLVRSIYFDTSFGLGTYIGSLSKINTPATIGIHKENHGFTGAVKFGFGYRFN